MNIKSESVEFASYLENWFAGVPSLALAEIIPQPQKVAAISVDITNGFCYTGALSSPRVADIVAPTRQLFVDLHRLGVRNFILTQDSHEPDAVEFAQWPAHCVRGTEESETVNEFKSLPFFSEFILFPKNSIQAAFNTGLPGWIEAHPEVDTFIVTGDCTDLCTYQLAMYLRLDANARQLSRRVLLPENCVQTYDIPVRTAVENQLSAHPGDFIHLLFLYHMALNGVEVIKTLE
jgi:nicotinamidase-related amidase